ncbi:MAG: hypothetical protein FJZ13_05515 [Candidatus Omnitrophica bacterium]|nr:hypothetical protein [Candidatus Omnitrophota bacterium]
MRKSAVKRRGDAGFLSLLGLIFTLAVICIMAYMLFNFYFKATLPQGKAGSSLSISEPGITGHSYHSTVDTARTKLKAIQEQQRDNLKQLQN